MLDFNNDRVKIIFQLNLLADSLNTVFNRELDTITSIADLGESPIGYINQLSVIQSSITDLIISTNKELERINNEK